MTSGGIKVWSDSARLFQDTNYHSNIVMLSMVGPRNAVRAIWARLNDSRKKYVSVQVGDTYCTTDSDFKYLTIQCPLNRRMLHLIILHPEATHQASPFSDRFLLIGPDPEVNYYTRLNRCCPIPFRPSWRQKLWGLGIEKGLIKPLRGFGIPGYEVNASEDWAEVIKTEIVQGTLK